MQQISGSSAVERAMKVQEVLVRAIGGQLSWIQAGEILGLCPRQVRRLRERFDADGYTGLFDRRREPSPKRVPVETVSQVLQLYRGQYADCNVQHFHELLAERHGIALSYSWVKKALQTAGLVPVGRRRGAHRRRRERRPLPGMLLHIDASRHAWLPGTRLHDLVSVSDDATNTLYYARLVPEENIRTVLAALQHVVATQGTSLLRALYRPRRALHSHTTSRARAARDASRACPATTRH